MSLSLTWDYFLKWFGVVLPDHQKQIIQYMLPKKTRCELLFFTFFSVRHYQSVRLEIWNLNFRTFKFGIAIVSLALNGKKSKDAVWLAFSHKNHPYDFKSKIRSCRSRLKSARLKSQFQNFQTWISGPDRLVSSAYTGQNSAKSGVEYAS